VSREEVQRMGRLMAVGLPMLRIISKTSWLLVLVLPLLTAIVYNGGVRRDKYIPVVATGSLSVPMWGLDLSVRIRPTANGKGSIFSISATTIKQKYEWGLGIA